jgi:hypothetical protein
MDDLDRHQFRPARRGVVGNAQQRRVAHAQLVAATGLKQMGQAHARCGTVEIGDVAFEPDRPGLPLAHPQMVARRLAFELHGISVTNLQIVAASNTLA